MRAAPPVELTAAWRGGWWVAACGLWSAAAGCIGAWLAWHLAIDGDGLAGLPTLLLALLPAAGLLALSATWLARVRRDVHTLRWTGRQWLCGPAHAFTEPAAGQVDLMLDLGDAMLLRWRADPGAASSSPRRLWLPVARARQSAAWHGARVALLQPTPAAAPEVSR